MSVVTIIAKQKQVEDWKVLLNAFLDLNLTVVEIFPIPKELGFESDAIGIAAPQSLGKKPEVISELLSVIKISDKFGFALYELYDGRLVNYTNAEEVLSPLIPN